MSKFEMRNRNLHLFVFVRGFDSHRAFLWFLRKLRAEQKKPFENEKFRVQHNSTKQKTINID